MLPVASLGSIQAPRCRPAAALPSAASSVWGSSVVAPSFAASPLQQRYGLSTQHSMQEYDGLRCVRGGIIAYTHS